MALDAGQINAALDQWRQGDLVLGASVDFLHLADLDCPLTDAAKALVAELKSTGEPVPTGPVPLTDSAVEGYVILTQTCDLVRNCAERPFVEICPLIKAESVEFYEEVRKNKRPQFATVAGASSGQLIADLDRVMTVEKSVVATWPRVPGCVTDDEVLSFARALRRRASRFAFPDDFEKAAGKLQERIISKHSKQSDEGAHLRALREIRVRASPCWDAREVRVSYWFVKEEDPPNADWDRWSDAWSALFDQRGRFKLDPPTVAFLEDMTALDYVESVRLDFDRLSVGQNVVASPAAVQ
jgi:hypothetical protein